MSTEFLETCNIITTNLGKFRTNAMELELLMKQKTHERRKLDSKLLDGLLDDTNGLIKRTRDVFDQLKNESNRTAKEQSLTASLESEYIDTLQRFVTAQRSSFNLVHETIDSSLRVPQQEVSSIQRKNTVRYDRDAPSPIAKRDVVSIERTNYRREQTQVRNNNREDPIVWRDMHFAPFRSFNDFILDATWNVPNFSDDIRMQNRITNNLMYYQTNYFIFGIICLILIAIMYPVDFIISVSLVAAFLRRSTHTPLPVSEHRASSGRQLRSSKSTRGSSVLILIILLGVAYYKLSLINTLIILLFGLALPILGMFFHAIFRKRNLMNKVANQLTRIRLRETPMSAFLRMLNAEDDDG